MNLISFNIGRIVTQGQLSNNRDERIEYCHYALLKACQAFNQRLSVLQTPGGFLYDFQDLKRISSGVNATLENFIAVTENAQHAVDRLLDDRLKEILLEKTDFLTIGLDVFDIHGKSEKQAELVGTYDTLNKKIIHWTGKSYPTLDQENSLIYCTKLETHFQKINDIPVMILGCHDLNLFSPRSRASVSKGSFRDKTISEIQTLSDRFKPHVVLQHPHFTDSPNIWQPGWSGIKRWVPSARIYSSGIHYANREGKHPRKPLQTILLRTALGPVENFTVPLHKLVGEPFLSDRKSP
jgi:hypothetical protein